MINKFFKPFKNKRGDDVDEVSIGGLSLSWGIAVIVLIIVSALLVIYKNSAVTITNSNTSSIQQTNDSIINH